MMSSGVNHWVDQRLTAILFLISTIACVLIYTSCEKESLTSSTFLVFFLISIATTIRHGYLGIQVILEDYIKSLKTRYFILSLIAVISLFACTLAIFSAIKYNVINSIKQDNLYKNESK